MDRFYHAGAPAYQREKFKPIEDGSKYAEYGRCLKPYGGFWGTPGGAPEFDITGKRDSGFWFTLAPSARVLHVYDSEELIKALRRRPSWDRRPVWVWMVSRWDAVWVHKLDGNLCHTGWDIESIVVLNPDMVVAPA